MPKREWSSQYETGVKEIDDQHRRLLEKIDRFQIALYQGRSKDELAGVISFLLSYIEEHLETEERILAECSFPDFKRHQEQHNDFREQCMKLIKRFNTGGADSFLAIEVEKLIVNWWENHVMKMDMACIPYVRKEADYL